MLYGSTRSKVVSDTSQRTVWQDRASDGGCYVPLKLPVFKRTEIIRLKNRSMEDNIALILNKFFQTEFSGKEIQYAIGREYYALTDVNQKLILAELWHNAEGTVEELVRLLARRISVDPQEGAPGDWPRIAVRIAVLFGLFGVLMDRGVLNTLYPMDLAVPAGDFSWPMAAWYGRRMGLPIGTVIVCCNENEGVRDLLCRGQVRLTSAGIATITPRYDDPAPQGLERAVYTVLGREEALEFARIQEKGGVYSINAEQRRQLAQGYYVAVNNSRRLAGVIPNAYRTFGRVMCPYTALVYTGVLDYQAMTGRYGRVLMVCDFGPEHSLEITARVMGIGIHELKKRWNLT